MNRYASVERAGFVCPRVRRRRFAAQPLFQIPSLSRLHQPILSPHWGRRQISQGNSIRLILKKEYFYSILSILL